MTYVLPAADLSVDYGISIGMDPAVTDYTGWTFDATFAAFVGDPEGIALGMAADDAHDGFRVFDGPGRIVTLRIKKETLQAYPNTSGQFTLFTNLLATPPGAARFHAADLSLTIQKGPTP